MVEATMKKTIKSEKFDFTLEAREERGTLWLKWSQTAPFRAQQDKICVYNADFPSDPSSNVKAASWGNENNADWNTGLPAGKGWHCAWIAQKSPNGPYAYVVKLITED